MNMAQDSWNNWSFPFAADERNPKQTPGILAKTGHKIVG